jgi:hypothetical protein
MSTVRFCLPPKNLTLLKKFFIYIYEVKVLYLYYSCKHLAKTFLSKSFKSLILAQIERLRHALHMQVERRFKI